LFPVCNIAYYLHSATFLKQNHVFGGKLAQTQGALCNLPEMGSRESGPLQFSYRQVLLSKAASYFACTWAWGVGEGGGWDMST